MRLDALLQRLEAEQNKIAHETLQQPSGPDPFNYGRAVGLYHGIELAKTVLIELVNETEQRKYNL